MTSKKNFFNSKGFTLVEMLIVVAMLGVLISAVVAYLNPLEQLKKGNDLRRKTDLSQVQKALEKYYNDVGRYPRASASYTIINLAGNSVAWGTSWQPYMNVLPKDPKSDRRYVYIVSEGSGGQSYWIYANLERGSKDPNACNSGAACGSVPAGVFCGGTSSLVCNFGVSSPNVSP